MHVVFDLDGVLLDSESDLGWLDRALDETLREFDLAVTDENRRKLYPINIDEFRRTADRLGIDPVELWRVRDERYRARKLDALESGRIAAFPDIDALDALAPEYPLHVISNSPESIVEAFVEKHSLRDRFEVLIGRGTALEDIERLKPHPHFYRRLRDRTNGASSFVYVGDTETDRTFAEETGMEFIHVERAGGPVAGLDDVVEHLTR